MHTRQHNVRYMTVTAMLSAVAFALMFFEFSIPFLVPSFIQMDLSELPALIGAFAMGPWYGVIICLIKNLIHLLITTTGGVGELSNFILGAAFVLPAGLIYQRKKTKKKRGDRICPRSCVHGASQCGVQLLHRVSGIHGVSADGYDPCDVSGDPAKRRYITEMPGHL